MILRRHRLWHVVGAGLALALLLGYLGVQAGPPRQHSPPPASSTE